MVYKVGMQVNDHWMSWVEEGLERISKSIGNGICALLACGRPGFLATGRLIFISSLGNSVSRW